MSEVIETYIRSNPGLSEAEAFEGFLKQDRIRAWVGTDTTRRERLSKEFAKVWNDMTVAAPSPAPATSARAGPAMQQAQAIQAPPPQKFPVVAPSEAVPPATRAPRRLPGAGTRKLDLLCTSCGKIDVWNQEGVITCRACGLTYDNMLALVPVEPVGTFEYLFGDGATGWIAAGGIAALLVGVYLVVKIVG